MNERCHPMVCPTSLPHWPPAFAEVTESIATAGPTELRQAFILRREGGLPPANWLLVPVQGSRLQNFLPQHRRDELHTQPSRRIPPIEDRVDLDHLY